MILFTVIAIVVLLILAIIFFVTTIGGAAFVLLFGDVIVCGLLIYWIIKHLFKGKKK